MTKYVDLTKNNLYSLMKTSETKKEEETKEKPKKGPFIKEEPKAGHTIKKEPLEKPNVKEGPTIIKEEPKEEEPRLVTVKVWYFVTKIVLTYCER